jgi:hypothetical protein
LKIFDLIRSFLQACDFKSKYWLFDFKSNLFFDINILFTMKYVPVKVWHQFLLFWCYLHNGELCRNKLEKSKNLKSKNLRSKIKDLKIDLIFRSKIKRSCRPLVYAKNVSVFAVFARRIRV